MEQLTLSLENKDIMVLNKHNTLVKGRYNLTSIQNKIYQFILFNTQKNVVINEDMAIITIDREDFKMILPPRECEAKRLISNFEKIRARPLQYKRLDPEGNLIWSGYSFFSSYHYYEKTQKMEFKIELELVKMLTEYVKVGYTPVNIHNIKLLNSYYSQRLYELLRLWSNSKQKITYTVEEIREYMMLDEKKSYNSYGLLKDKVISPAIDELNGLNIFKIEYEEHKKYKGKVESITFYVEDLDKRVYDYKKENDEPIGLRESDIKNIENNQDIIHKEVSITSENQGKFDVPNKKLFTAKTLQNLESDFGSYDFKDKIYKKLLQDAIFATLEKDDEEKIKVKCYNYFKTTLENKIKELKVSETKTEIKTKKPQTTHHNINQTFSKYSPEQLEMMLQESQKGKFK